MKHLDLITIIIGALTLILGIAGIIISLILRSEYMIVSICGCTMCFVFMRRFMPYSVVLWQNGNHNIYANMLHHLYFSRKLRDIPKY